MLRNERREARFIGFSHFPGQAFYITNSLGNATEKPEKNVTKCPRKE